MCRYCYVYEMADQSWRTQPRRMSLETVRIVATRLAEHARAHDLTAVRVILHGGEPLLAGHPWLSAAARILRDAAPPGTDLGLTLQTNGVLLTADVVAVLAEHDIQVSVSLDGPATAHDRYRRFADGRGSHAAAVAGICRLTSTHPRLFRGLLCVVDPATDPRAVLAELMSHRPPAVDFLLPHGTWSAPPPGRVPGDPATPYADWLGAAFEAWYDAPAGETEVRLFAEIIQLLLGGASRSESAGLSPAASLVVETDGAMEEVDALKAAYEGAAATGLHAARDPFDAALWHPTSVARQLGRAALADECVACPAGRVCGGGFYPHRYRAGSGFRNPSVYCPDLLKLVGHIARRLHADLAPRP